LQDAIAKRSDSTVVELAGEVVAFANFYRWEAGGTCSIGNVIVSPATRGRGIGRYLIEQMTSLAFSKHLASEVTVSCFNQNVAGLLLYSKLDFGRMPSRNEKAGKKIRLRSSTCGYPEMQPNIAVKGHRTWNSHPKPC
jgi:ribosomal protein S18 acetylase RimI-like enzyme